VQKPNAVKEPSAAYQTAPARRVNQPVAKNLQSSKPGGQPPVTHRPLTGGKQPATHDVIEDHFEWAEDRFYEEDPFAGEIFPMDEEESTASAPPVEDFGVPQHDNPLAESTADYGAHHAPTREPMAEVVKREFAASLRQDQSRDSVSTSSLVQAEPAPQKKGNGHTSAYDTLPEPYRFAKVVISRSGDSLLDASRVGEVHHLLSSYPGPDRFCFLIKARGETLQLDFPNDTTTLDEMMIDQLKGLHGVESVQISMSL
jgi:hypothetical protein